MTRDRPAAQGPRICNCLDPGPEMIRLQCAGRIRYFLCRHCGVIRREVPEPGEVERAYLMTLHEVIDEDLPAPIRAEAWDLLRAGWGGPNEPTATAGPGEKRSLLPRLNSW